VRERSRERGERGEREEERRERERVRMRERGRTRERERESVRSRSSEVEEDRARSRERERERKRRERVTHVGRHMRLSASATRAFHGIIALPTRRMHGAPVPRRREDIVAPPAAADVELSPVSFTCPS